MSEEKLVNFQLDAKIYHDLKMLAVRENRTIKDILKEEIESYIKVHKEGNPQHLLSKFIENEDFTGFPSIAVNKQKKKEYLMAYCVELNDKEKLNPFGIELWNHVTQWYHLMEKL